jgi:hypothetical protein
MRFLIFLSLVFAGHYQAVASEQAAPNVLIAIVVARFTSLAFT